MLFAARVSENRHYETPPLRSVHRPRLNPPPASAPSSDQLSSPPPSALPQSASESSLASPVSTERKVFFQSTVSGCKFLIGDDYEGEEPYDRHIGSEDSSPTLQERRNFKQDICNNNEFLSKECCLRRGIPLEAFPPSLIKWPLNSSNKSSRVAAVRQQVAQLSKVIKMTIEDGSEDAGGANAPFSSYVDVPSLQPHMGINSSKDSYLPNWNDFEALLTSGRNKEAKQMLRESDWGLDEAIRSKLWKKLGERNAKEEFSDTYYWDTVQQMYGTSDLTECEIVLPTFLDQRYILNRSLSPDGVKVCKRIVSVIGYSFPAITYAPTIYPICALLLHFMDESDAYNCLSSMLNSSNDYIFQTKAMHETMWRTVETLARKHVRGSFAMLHKYGISSQEVDDGFHNWIWWILAHLPFPHLVRVMDCFMLEGLKVLLRCSLAVFHLFVKNASRDPNKVAVLTTKGIDEALTQYCQDINVPPSKLLKTAFGIRAFSKAEINKVILHTEMLLKSEQNLHGHEVSSGPLKRTASLEGLPSSQSHTDIQMMSHTLAIKEGSSTPMPRTVAMGQYPLKKIRSMIASQDELLMVWSWLPMRMTMRQPTLIYTTEEHGSSITTFYKRVEDYEPFIMLIRTLKDDVFGAYCSTSLKQRHVNDEFGNRQTYFGTGESFLFVLRPSPKKYEWVGITRQRENAELSSVEHSSELFIHADNDMISIGGGSGHGLMLDHEFQFGKTEPCQTFDNKPLCEDSNFEIKVVEVFALTET